MSMAATAAAVVAVVTGTVIAVLLFCVVTMFCFAYTIVSLVEIAESASYLFKILQAQANRVYG